MIPETMHIGHFRAIRECTVVFSDHTVLVGPNGAGKSTVLQALRFFFEPAKSANLEDFQFGCEDDISVTVTLGSLNDRECEAYADYLDETGRLTVTKSSLPGEAVHFSMLGRSYKSFDDLRSQSRDKASVFNAAYKAYAEAHPELGLSKTRSLLDGKAELRRFEREHPELLEDASIDFEFIDSSKVQLVGSMRVIYIPAVHRADEDFKPGRSPLGQMIEALVMPEVEQKPEFMALQERWEAEYRAVFPAGGVAELQDLANKLSAALKDFVPGAEVNLCWGSYRPEVPTPDVESFVSEDGVPTQIDMQGHGLQRAMIIALLQARDEQLRESTKKADDAELTHVLLLIEEPELYQHPPRARHFRRILTKLSKQTAKNSRFRVVSTTHSPSFIALEDLESIRIVRKEANPGGVPRRAITSVTLEDVAERFSGISDNKNISRDWLLRNLHALDAPLREAFFAHAIILTEGVSDIGMLSAEAERQNLDLEAKGVVFSSTDGKGQLALAITILNLLGIKYYVVFDSDSASQLAENQRIFRSLGVAEEHIPKIGTPDTAVNETYAVLKPKIEAVVSEDFGVGPYQKALSEVASFYNKKREEVMKNPVAAKTVIVNLHESGLRSKTLAAIVTRLSTL